MGVESKTDNNEWINLEVGGGGCLKHNLLRTITPRGLTCVVLFKICSFGSGIPTIFEQEVKNCQK
jgi:hypothetical protein